MKVGVPIFDRAFRGPREAREGAVQKQGRGHFRHFPPAARRERLGPVEPLERRLDCAALFRAEGNDAHVGVDDVEVAREQVAAVVGHHLQAGQPVALTFKGTRFGKVAKFVAELAAQNALFTKAAPGRETEVHCRAHAPQTV